MKKIFYTSLLIGLFTCQLFAKIGVIVNKDLYPFVQQSITQYVFDINQIEKKSVWLEKSTFDAAGNIFALRDSLRSHYENDSLEGVVFVGDLPIAYYEIENDYKYFDTNGIECGYWYKTFPIDIFYMDLDGTWLDTAADGAWKGNAQTGYFDGHTGNKFAEIWMSRITAGVTTGLGAEQNIVNDYFNKVHKYMAGNFKAPERYLIFGNDTEWVDMVSWANANQLGYKSDSVDTYLRSKREDTRENWSEGLTRGYESAFIAEHSSYILHNVCDGNDYYNSTYLNGDTTNTRFYNLYACSNSRYTEINFLGGLYAWGHNGLVSVGSTKTGSMLNFDSYYIPMSNDSSFGESFKYWLNNTVLNSNDSSKVYWHYGMTLCGTGSLHMKYGTKLRISPEEVEDSARITFVINDSSLVGEIMQLAFYREDGMLMDYYRCTASFGENTFDVRLGTYPLGTYMLKLSAMNDSVMFRITQAAEPNILTLSSDQIDFGETEIGTTDSMAITIINSGKNDITINNLWYTNTSFKSDLTYPLLISARSQKTIIVTYSPTYIVENETGTINIITDKQQNLIIPLKGTGSYKTELSVNPSEVITNAVVTIKTKNYTFYGRTANFDLYSVHRNGSPIDLIQQFTVNINSEITTFTKSDWDNLRPGSYELQMRVNQKLVTTYQFRKLSNTNFTDFSVSPSPVVDNATIAFNTESSDLIGRTAYLICRQNEDNIFSHAITIVNGRNEYSMTFNDYNPLRAGNYTMVLEYESSVLASVSFTKEDKSASLTISPIRIAFGQVNVGTQKTTQLTLFNTGNVNALISSVTFGRSVFTYNGAQTVTVKPKESVTLDLVFAPTALGEITDTLTIINAPFEIIQTLKVSVSAFGVENGGGTPENISVVLTPDSDINDNSIQSQIRIKNSGSTPVDLSNLVLEYYTYDPNANVNNLRCDIYYCSAGYVSASFKKLPFVMGNSSYKADLVTEISLSGTLGANQEMSLQYGTHSADWQYMFNETDDWSRVTGSANTSSNIVIRNKVTGEILSGNMPQ